MSNDASRHECESEIDHYTGHYLPYSLRRVCGFFNVPQIFYYMCKGLFEKTRKSNRLQMLLQRQHFIDPECWSGRDLNLRPPAQQSGAYPIELTGRRLAGDRAWCSRFLRVQIEVLRLEELFIIESCPCYRYRLYEVFHLWDKEHFP